MEQQKQITSGLSIASMVCGIVSLIPMGGISIIVGIIAIILSVIAKKDIANNSKGGAGFATTGLVCGIIAVALYTLLLVVAGTLIASLMTSL